MERGDFAVRALQVALGFSLVWFAAGIVASQWRNIIRLYEGYPFANANTIGERSKAWYWKRREYFSERGDRWALYYQFTQRERDMLPTRLGNILRAAERYGYYRYRLDTIVVWPRLYHLLDRKVVDDVEDARATLEFLLVVSLWSTLAGIGGTTVLVLAGDPIAVALIVMLAGWVGAYLAYLSAIPAAIEYGEQQLRSTTELYRLKLLEHLRLPAPGNMADERAIWKCLSAFIGAGRRLKDEPIYQEGEDAHLLRVVFIDSAE